MSSSPTPARRRVGHAAVVGLVLVVVAAAAACSSGGTNAKRVAPDDSADLVATTFSLPVEQRSCLADAFRKRPEATEALEISAQPTAEQLQRLEEVLAGCVEPASLADSVASSAANGIGGLDPTQVQCLRDGVIALSPDDRGTLLVGLVVANAQGTSTLGVELGRVTSGLLDRCGVRLPASTGPTTPASPGATSLEAPPATGTG